MRCGEHGEECFHYLRERMYHHEQHVGVNSKVVLGIEGKQTLIIKWQKTCLNWFYCWVASKTCKKMNLDIYLRRFTNKVLKT